MSIKDTERLVTKMKLLSLFSGIGAFEKALTRQNIEYELVGFSEIDKYAITAYCAIHGVDESLNLGDITEIDLNKVPDCDIITHGSPCQSFSVAGKGEGGDKGSGTRSSLMWYTVEIVKHKFPKYVIWENVKGVLSKKHKHNFDQYLNELEKLGYNNYYRVLNSKDYGIPQNRERIYVISIRKDIDKGHFKFPKPFDNGLRLKDLLEDEVEEKYYINNEKAKKLIKELKDKEIGNSIKIGGNGVLVNEPKRLGGLYDTGKSRRQAGSVWDKEGIAPTLDTMQGGHREPLIIDENKLNFVGGLSEKDWAGDGKKLSRNYPQGERAYDSEGIACSQTSQGGGTGSYTGLYLIDYRIRKLTPLECWRLMDFDDKDYWKARRALEEKYYKGRDRSDSQMYKMAGNSITVGVLELVFKNLFI